MLRLDDVPHNSMSAGDVLSVAEGDEGVVVHPHARACEPCKKSNAKEQQKPGGGAIESEVARSDGHLRHSPMRGASY
jgi:hypothetical protein